MRKPERRSTPIDLKRYKKWADEFSGYRHQIQESRIRDWLKYFSDDDRDLAARLLDCIHFINNEQIRAAFRGILEGLPGWDRISSRRTAKWRFVPYSSSSGESGDSMMHVFRQANNLAATRFNDLFIYRSDLLRERLGMEDTVVLVDDMIGSGSQVCSSWDEGFSELLAGVGQVYLVVVAACDHAIQRVSDSTDMVLVPDVQLHDADNFFHSACKYFHKDEKETMLRYCKLVDEENPKGFGDSGLVLVFAHTIPNNTLPVLGKSTDDWEPLFRRYD